MRSPILSLEQLLHKSYPPSHVGRWFSNMTPHTPESSKRIFLMNNKVRRILELKQVKIYIVIRVLNVNKSLNGYRGARNLDIFLPFPHFIDILLICLKGNKLFQVSQIKFLKLECSLKGNQSTNHNKANEMNPSFSQSPFET
jgi:hypothetical protein